MEFIRFLQAHTWVADIILGILLGLGLDYLLGIR